MVDLVAVAPVKLCPRCGVEKQVSEFTIRRSGRIGHAVAHCKPCRAESVKRQTSADPSVYRRIQWPSKLRRFYGITVDQYYEILARQGGSCAICKTRVPGGRKYKRVDQMFFAVDHDHATGRVRGLLCHKCNRALGLIGDSPEIARQIAAYLGR